MISLPNYDNRLEAPYWDRDDAQKRWEIRADALAAVRPQVTEALAETVLAGLGRVYVEWDDVLSLRAALGTWLDGLRDGELEDRIAVELGILEDWSRP